MLVEENLFCCHPNLLKLSNRKSDTILQQFLPPRKQNAAGDLHRAGIFSVGVVVTYSCLPNFLGLGQKTSTQLPLSIFCWCFVDLHFQNRKPLHCSFLLSSPFNTAFSSTHWGQILEQTLLHAIGIKKIPKTILLKIIIIDLPFKSYIMTRLWFHSDPRWLSTTTG